MKSIRLYDLVLENGCTISPFVWRIKYAIAHKGFGVESVPVGFTGRKQFPDHARTVYDNVTLLARLFRRLDPLSGRRRGRPAHFGLLAIINDSLGLFVQAMADARVTTTVNCEESLKAYGYREDLQAALVNLIDNAVYWLSVGRTDERLICIDARGVGRSVEVRISNNGPPIDTRYAPRLFDAGFTLKSDGTGLGLAIAREALNRSRAQLSFDETADDVTFVIRLRREPENQN